MVIRHARTATTGREDNLETLAFSDLGKKDHEESNMLRQNDSFMSVYNMLVFNKKR